MKVQSLISLLINLKNINMKLTRLKLNDLFI
jgi:hypothetical protein